MSQADIVVAYRDWSAPIDVTRIVSRLLSTVPARYLAGLGSIVLSNASGLDRQRRRAKTLSRKHKASLAAARGLYHPRSHGRAAAIELFVDNIVEPWPHVLLRLPFVQDVAFGDVLFHEIGHHVHTTQVPEFREPEDVAEAWEERFSGSHLRRRYWYLVIALRPVFWLVSRVRRAGILRPRSQSSVVPAGRRRRPTRGRGGA